MNKNIVIIGVNYYPEDSAIGLYTTQKAEYLASKGYHVSVVTGFPYYPQWKIRKEYIHKKKWIKEKKNDVTILRYKQYVPSNPSFVKRIIHLLSFSLGSLINLFKLHKPDVVICIVPFTSTVLLGWFLKIRFNSKLWVHIQDFEFDAAIDSGLLSQNKSILIKLLIRIERVLLKKADVVSTISNGMLEKLNSKVKVKNYYLTNWLDTSAFQKQITQSHNYLSSSNFKILYSGNIGAKQDWDFFFLFLNEIRNLKNIEVVIVGEGAELERVKNEIRRHDFVKQYSLVPFEELYCLLSSADLHILFQKDDVIDTVMPSKILGMMGSARPSIITGNKKSEVKQIIDESKGGFYFQNNQLNEIIKVVNVLKQNTDYKIELGKNAKDYVIKNYSKSVVLDEFLNQLRNI